MSSVYLTSGQPPSLAAIFGGDPLFATNIGASPKEATLLPPKRQDTRPIRSTKASAIRACFAMILLPNQPTQIGL